MPIGEPARSLAAEYSLAGRHGRDLVTERKAATEHSLSLGDAYCAYADALRRRGASQNTLRLNGRNWSAFISRYEAKDLTAVSRADVRSWHSDWGEHGPTVANQSARLLRAVFNYAITKLTTTIVENPCRAIEYFRERNQRRSVAAEDLAQWWLAVGRIENPIRRGYWQFLLFTGLRKEDAATLRWADVQGNYIHRPCPKGGSSKAFDVPLTEQVATILHDVKQAGLAMFPESEFVFPADSGCGRLVSAREPKHVPNCSPHDVRRTYATLCIQAGVDPYTTKLLLNHAADTSDVTARYVIPSAESRAAAARRVAEHITSLITGRDER